MMMPGEGGGRLQVKSWQGRLQGGTPSILYNIMNIFKTNYFMFFPLTPLCTRVTVYNDQALTINNFARFWNRFEIFMKIFVVYGFKLGFQACISF